LHYNTKGGTTFFSSLIAAAPDVASRYECGLLQARTPSEIPSIRPEVQKNMIRHWQLPDDGMERLAACQDFGQVFSQLYHKI